MRHRCKTPQLSLPADQRKALMRSLTTEVIRHGRITTTLARAKAIRGSVRFPYGHSFESNGVSVDAVETAMNLAAATGVSVVLCISIQESQNLDVWYAWSAVCV